MEENFRLVISIIRGTVAGRALQKMASGQIVGFESQVEAIKAKDEWRELATAITDSVDEKIVLGSIAVIDFERMCFVSNQLIYGKMPA